MDRGRPGAEDHRTSNAPLQPGEEVRVSDLGSGSDFTPFLQHAGVPSTDIGSDGPYGVYHSTFDDYAWFTMNADPKFVYLQEMARVFGIEALRMADADVLPYDYPAYAREIVSYVNAAKRKAQDDGLTALDFGPAETAAARFSQAAVKAHALQIAPPGDLASLNRSLRAAETDLLAPQGPAQSPLVPATPSTRPASTPATPPWSFPASTRRSTPMTQPAHSSSSRCSPRPSVAPRKPLTRRINVAAPFLLGTVRPNRRTVCRTV